MTSVHITELRIRVGLGWKPDLPDHRDLHFPVDVARVVPEKVDLRGPLMSSVYDQGQLGSCTANAIAGGLQFLEAKQGEAQPEVPSRLFIYYNERVAEGTVSYDAGAAIRDGIKSVHKLGCCSEAIWPYEPSKFAMLPPAAAFLDAKKDLVSQYLRIPHSVPAMQMCLADGFPFVFGFTVYESFVTDAVARSGLIPMPKSNEQVAGGHAVLAVGYDGPKRVFIVRNSWGSSWGEEGYGYMPFEYLGHRGLASDFWTMRRSNS